LQPFAIQEDGDTIGFEIDLAREVVIGIFGDDVAIEWVPVSAENRLKMIRQGELDLLLRSTTHTLSREADALWTVPYFLDGMRLVVAAESGMTQWAQLAGKTICVNQGTLAEDNLTAFMLEQGITIEMIELGMGEPFIAGECVAVASDWSLLMHQGLAFNMMGGEDPVWVTIGDLMTVVVADQQLGYEPFAIGVNPAAPALHEAADEVLRMLVADGTWQALYDQWIPEAAPWTPAEMLAAPPANR
jgi:ABC-type amino acid transport substrate-binding protein